MISLALIGQTRLLYTLANFYPEFSLSISDFDAVYASVSFCIGFVYFSFTILFTIFYCEYVCLLRCERWTLSTNLMTKSIVIDSIIHRKIVQI